MGGSTPCKYAVPKFSDTNRITSVFTVSSRDEKVPVANDAVDDVEQRVEVHRFCEPQAVGDTDAKLVPCVSVGFGLGEADGVVRDDRHEAIAELLFRKEHRG